MIQLLMLDYLFIGYLTFIVRCRIVKFYGKRGKCEIFHFFYYFCVLLWNCEEFFFLLFSYLSHGLINMTLQQKEKVQYFIYLLIYLLLI